MSEAELEFDFTLLDSESDCEVLLRFKSSVPVEMADYLIYLREYVEQMQLIHDETAGERVLN